MKKLLIALLTLSFLIPISPIIYGKETIWQQTQNVSFSGGSRTVTAIYVDLNDKTIRMESVLAKNQVGKVDDLKNIAQQANKENQKVVGAINGTFFNAYSSDPQPTSTIETKGKFEFMSESGSAIGFTGDNTVMIDRLKVSVIGAINGNYESPNNWDVWGLNNTQATSETIFTPAFGKTTGKHNKTSVVVENGVVTKILKGEAVILPSGYTLALNSPKYFKKFSVGDQVDYKLKFFKLLAGGKSNPIPWENVRTTVGAGPTLVKNGFVLADGKLENFKEDKINTNRGQRSFIGVTNKNILIMGTVPNVSVKELGAIVKKLGLFNALNLDGGASSGLYYNGKYLTNPGRKLSNALVITKLTELPLRIKLNNNELFYDNDPYLTKTGIVMVPLKQILNTFGSQFNTSTLTAKRGKITLVFKTGSSLAKVNNIDNEMGAPLEIKSGNLYVPLEFLMKTFGGNIKIDSAKKTVSINIDDINTTDTYNTAEQALLSNDTTKAEIYYMKALELDSNHSASLLKLAKLNLSKKDYLKSAKYYEQYFNINPRDFEKLANCAWAYYSGRYYDETVSVFMKLTKLQPNVAAHWINLGTIYTDYNIKKYDQARECFKKALTLNPSQKEKDKITLILGKIQGK
jgi:tetratricopeptide (TPR) repeat protein